MSAPVYAALLHYPVTNRQGDTVTTAVTTIDIPDIARSARTFGLDGFYIVTPVHDQQRLVKEIVGHWTSDSIREYHPPRVQAMSLVRVVSSFAEVVADIRRRQAPEGAAEDTDEAVGEAPEVVLTSAKPWPSATAVGYEEYRAELADPARTRPSLLVFGTGWGIAGVFSKEIHRVLPPVRGPEKGRGYNHLSVRAAAAIIFDRLFGC